MGSYYYVYLRIDIRIYDLGDRAESTGIMLQNLPIMLFIISLIFAYYACFYAFWLHYADNLFICNCINCSLCQYTCVLSTRVPSRSALEDYAKIYPNYAGNFPYYAGNFPYYAGIMLYASQPLLCLKSCQHNQQRPNRRMHAVMQWFLKESTDSRPEHLYELPIYINLFFIEY